MHRPTRYRRYILLSIPALLLLTAAVSDTTQRILRGFDLIGMVYRQVITEYVDEVDADELLKAGVDGMLKSLDPYAELIEQRENSEVDALSRGSYGGLGIKVKRNNGSHYVSDIYEEIRSLTNLRIGDILLRVDGRSIKDEQITDLRPLLRGVPGTTVRLVVRRPGISDSLELAVLRRRVTLNPLTLGAVFDDGILYLKLSRFTRSSADSVRHFMQRSFAAHSIQGVIIDVRDNPGGLLEAAVALVDQFIPPGLPIVSMRGRQPTYAREYPSRVEAIDEEVPVAVLVNGRSASASEIVAGAFQDLDRGIVIGERTFGKGLVQTLVPLSHNATLKLTTSRYYIPSGRCIQKLVYENGEAHDKLEGGEPTLFKTLRLGRDMEESTGIIPDVVLSQDSLPGTMQCLQRQDGIFKFVALYNNRYSPSDVPEIDGDVEAMFRKYYDSLTADQGGPLLSAYEALRKEAEGYVLQSDAKERLEDLEKALRKTEAAEFVHCWPQVRSKLAKEFTLQIHGESAYIQSAVTEDDAISTARQLLADEEALRAAMLGSESY